MTKPSWRKGRGFMTIKERVLHIAEEKGLSKVAFFKELGLSYANFKGPQMRSSLSADALVVVLHKYPEISPAWLLLGEGVMLRATSADAVSTDASLTIEPLNSALQQVVSAQEKTITLLERQISLLEQELQAYKK